MKLTTHPGLAALNLSVRAGARELVRELSVQFIPGEVVAILGRNGSGKTLTLHTLAGLRTAAAGEVRRAVHGRVQRISSAVAGPTTTSRRPCGISKSCSDSARRPAMISARTCGYRGSRSGSAKPIG